MPSNHMAQTLYDGEWRSGGGAATAVGGAYTAVVCAVYDAGWGPRLAVAAHHGGCAVAVRRMAPSGERRALMAEGDPNVIN